jgi:predicted nucleic acid-binding protein
MIFVDSCVLIDVLEDDPRWADWSQRQLDAAVLNGPLAINAIIYAEISVGFERIEQVDAMIEQARISLKEMPRAALFLAAKAYQRYRARGGSRSSTLPDFFIGAHAAVLGVPLLTRDVRRFEGYFPTLRLIAPASERD